MHNAIVSFLNQLGNFLRNPNSKLVAFTTPSGRQVIKATSGVASGIVKRSAVRYSTGTIVETIVYKP